MLSLTFAFFGRNAKPCKDPTRAKCVHACSDKPYKPRELLGKGRCSYVEIEDTEEESLNKLLDEKEVEKEGQEEQDEKKHYLIEVEDEKGADDDGEPELGDEDHGKDMNRVMSK